MLDGLATPHRLEIEAVGKIFRDLAGDHSALKPRTLLTTQQRPCSGGNYVMYMPPPGNCAVDRFRKIYITCSHFTLWFCFIIFLFTVENWQLPFFIPSAIAKIQGNFSWVFNRRCHVDWKGWHSCERLTGQPSHEVEKKRTEIAIRNMREISRFLHGFAPQDVDTYVLQFWPHNHLISKFHKAVVVDALMPAVVLPEYSEGAGWTYSDIWDYHVNLARCVGYKVSLYITIGTSLKS